MYEKQILEESGCAGVVRCIGDRTLCRLRKRYNGFFCRNSQTRQGNKETAAQAAGTEEAAEDSGVSFDLAAFEGEHSGNPVSISCIPLTRI